MYWPHIISELLMGGHDWFAYCCETAVSRATSII